MDASDGEIGRLFKWPIQSSSRLSSLYKADFSLGRGRCRNLVGMMKLVCDCSSLLISRYLKIFRFGIPIVPFAAIQLP